MNIHLSYKKYLAVPSVELQYYPDEPAKGFEIGNKPNWLKLVAKKYQQNGRGDFTSITYDITVDPKYADVLTPGIRFADVDLRYITAEEQRYRLGERLNVQLEIIDNVVLTLSKSEFDFEYHQGSAAPSSQPLTITTENAWEAVADQTWVTFSESAANGSSDIQVGVNPNGLTIGVHEATIQVDDGERIKQATVSLIVSGEENSGDHLKLSLTSLSFTEVHQQVPNRSGTFSIDSSLPVTITTNVPWLLLSAESAAAGEQQITVSTTATEGLALGSHPAKIKVESGYSARNISVLLRIVENHTSGIESGKLYFAHDRNVLVLGSATANAEALIEFTARAGNIGREYSRRIPFFNNMAEAVIGLETSSLLRPEPLPVNFFNGAFVPVRPLEMDFTIYDKVINSTAVTERQSFGQVKFLKGRSPAVPDTLTRAPKTIHLPKDGLVCLSFLTDAFSGISISGQIEDFIAVSGINSRVYSAVVNLGQYQLKKGDALTITAGPVKVDVIIKDTQLPTTRLIYLNEWDCPEVINLDGEVRVDIEDDSRTVTHSQAGKEITRIVEVKEPMSFRVGTGNIYSDAEARWLSGILRSKKSWLEIDGQRIEVVRSFSSLTISGTREFMRSYELTFESAAK